MDPRVLVAEVGSAHCALALARPTATRPQLESLRAIATPRGELSDVLRRYLQDASCRRPAGVAVAAAGRVRRLPDRTWASLVDPSLNIERESLAGLCSGRAWLASDLAAVAAALPWLRADELIAFGPTRSTIPGLRLVVGVGSAFGLAALTADDAVIETEAGFADLPAVSAEERQWLNRMAPLRRLALDAVLSGPGLMRLYEVIAGQPLLGIDDLYLRLRRQEAQALKTLTAFSTWLGRVCGNLVLSLGGWGGVYLTGSVPTELGAALDMPAFRRGFEDKAPYSADLAAVPVHRIAHDHPALLGMAALAIAGR